MRLEHPHGLQGHLPFGFDFRVDHVDGSIEFGRFSEDDQRGVEFQVFLHPFHPLEPNQLYRPGLIPEKGRQPLLAPDAHDLHGGDLSLDLDVRHLAMHLTYFVKFGAVDIFVGKIINQVAEGLNIQLFF